MGVVSDKGDIESFIVPKQPSLGLFREPFFEPGVAKIVNPLCAVPSCLAQKTVDGDWAFGAFDRVVGQR